MIRLSARLLEEIEQHAEREYPRECCGLLVGRITDDGRTREVHTTYPVANIFSEESERHHRMAIEPLEYARAERLHADEGLGVSRQYGITLGGAGLRRSVFVIDAEGIVRWKHVTLVGLTFPSAQTISAHLAPLKVG